LNSPGGGGLTLFEVEQFVVPALGGARVDKVGEVVRVCVCERELVAVLARHLGGLVRMDGDSCAALLFRLVCLWR
jgi:hypothetical protein